MRTGQPQGGDDCVSYDEIPTIGVKLEHTVTIKRQVPQPQIHNPDS